MIGRCGAGVKGPGPVRGASRLGHRGMPIASVRTTADLPGPGPVAWGQAARRGFFLAPRGEAVGVGTPMRRPREGRETPPPADPRAFLQSPPSAKVPVRIARRRIARLLFNKTRLLVSR